ncbi:MAG: NAD(P)H-binding protein [Gammaproteobacteria bacterium]|nr:NAD(P)H-binding protein [Gammaproteobacteria bacterium]
MNKKTKINTWIIGCGNTGQRVSKLLQKKSINISATSHSSKSIKHLESLGVRVFPANLDEPTSLSKLDTNNANIYYFAPPAPMGEKDQRMSNFLDSLDSGSPPKRIVYISTSGVYGDHNGEWITEQTTAAPHNARSKRRLHAEELIKQFCDDHSTEYMILRVAGIYDFKKLPLNRIDAGLKVLKADIAPASNRIHGADLANICLAAMQSEHSNDTFNVADGNPSSITDYFIQTARLFSLTLPQEISWTKAQDELSPEMLSYLTESKKIDATYMLDKLGISLLYPTLAEGLVACKREYDEQIE